MDPGPTLFFGEMRSLFHVQDQYIVVRVAGHCFSMHPCLLMTHRHNISGRGADDAEMAPMFDMGAAGCNYGDGHQNVVLLLVFMQMQFMNIVCIVNAIHYLACWFLGEGSAFSLSGKCSNDYLRVRFIC